MEIAINVNVLLCFLDHNVNSVALTLESFLMLLITYLSNVLTEFVDSPALIILLQIITGRLYVSVLLVPADGIPMRLKIQKLSNVQHPPLHWR